MALLPGSAPPGHNPTGRAKPGSEKFMSEKAAKAARKAALLKAEANSLPIGDDAPQEEVQIPQIDFEFRGVSYVIRGDVLNNVEVLEFMEDEKWIKTVRAVLGLEQWGRFKESVRDERGVVPSSELEALLQVVMEVADPRSAS